MRFMDKIIVNPEEVRALGDIVSPKTSSDFLGYSAKITTSTDSDLGTVYTSQYLTGTVMELDIPSFISEDTASILVTLTLTTTDGTWVLDDVQVYVNDWYVPQHTGNDGTATINFSTRSHPAVDGKWIIRCTYAGTNSRAGCTAHGVIHIGEVTSLSLTGDKSVIQSSDTVNFVADVTGENTNGSVIEFVRETDNGILINDSTEYTHSTGGLKTLFELSDLGNKWELSCNFKSTVESRFVIGSKSNFSGTNPTNNIIIGSPNGNKAYYGYRDSSTHTTDLGNVSITSYVSFKIAYNNGNVTFTINGTDYTLSNITIFNNVTDFVIGMVSWSNSATVYVKDIKLKVFRELE